MTPGLGTTTLRSLVAHPGVGLAAGFSGTGLVAAGFLAAAFFAGFFVVGDFPAGGAFVGGLVIAAACLDALGFLVGIFLLLEVLPLPTATEY